MSRWARVEQLAPIPSDRGSTPLLASDDKMRTVNVLVLILFDSGHSPLSIIGSSKPDHTSSTSVVSKRVHQNSPSNTPPSIRNFPIKASISHKPPRRIDSPKMNPPRTSAPTRDFQHPSNASPPSSRASLPTRNSRGKAFPPRAPWQPSPPFA